MRHCSLLSSSDFGSLDHHALVERGMILTVAERARAPIIELRYGLPWYFTWLRVVDAVVDRPVYRHEGDILRQASGDDPPRLLSHGGLIPTRALPVVAAHVEGVVDSDGPDPRRRAVS